MSPVRSARGGSLMDRGDTSEKILRAAAELFGERGFGNTSIRDIAESAGMLPGSLYYYVERKEDLFYGVLLRQHEDLLAMRAEQDDEGEPGLDRIRTFVDRHLAFSLGPVGRVASYQFEFHVLDEKQRASIVGLRRRYERALVDLFELAQREGGVCTDLEPRASARAVLSLLNSLQRWLWNERDRDADTSLIRAQYSDLAIASIACEPSAHVDGHRGRLGRTASTS